MSQIKIDMTVYDSIETKLMAAHPAYRSKDPEIKKLLKLRKKLTKVLFGGIEPSTDPNYFLRDLWIAFALRASCYSFLFCL